MGWENKCRLCGTTENIEFCKMCGYYFCQECKTKYPERVIAMMKEKSEDAVHIVKQWLGLI